MAHYDDDNRQGAENKHLQEVVVEVVVAYCVESIQVPGVDRSVAVHDDN